MFKILKLKLKLKNLIQILLKMEDGENEKIKEEILQVLEELKDKRELTLFETFLYYFFKK